MRCAIYCRLSREDADKLSESESIQNQKALLISHALEQHWDIYQIYCDEDYSGADATRPAFLSMIQAAKESCFDLILCKTQSRFTRDMELVERYIHGLFPLWGIRFIAIADHVDTGVKGNKKARQINGLINEWYLEDLSENIRMVFAHKRSAGLHIGSFALYGYEKHPSEKGKLIVDPVASVIVQRIFHLALAGHGKQSIANILNTENIPNPTLYKINCGHHYVNGSMRDSSGLWSRSSVNRILHNEMYLGNMVQGKYRKQNYKSKTLTTTPKSDWFYVTGTHESIIDKKTFDAVQSLRSTRQKSDGSGTPHLLAGLVLCSSCGSSMQKNSYNYKQNKYSYLRCTNKACKKHHGTHSIRLDDLLEVVKAQVIHKINAWYHPSPPKKPLAQNHQPSKLQQALHSIMLKKEQHKKALEQAYLDKLSSHISETQFSLLANSLSESIESLDAQEAHYKTQLVLEKNMQTVQHPNDTKALLIEKHLHRSLFLQLIHHISIEEKNGNDQIIHIHWNM